MRFSDVVTVISEYLGIEGTSADDMADKLRAASLFLCRGDGDVTTFSTWTASAILAGFRELRSVVEEEDEMSGVQAEAGASGDQQAEVRFAPGATMPMVDPAEPFADVLAQCAQADVTPAIVGGREALAALRASGRIGEWASGARGRRGLAAMSLPATLRGPRDDALHRVEVACCDAVNAAAHRIIDPSALRERDVLMYCLEAHEAVVAERRKLVGVGARENPAPPLITQQDVEAKNAENSVLAAFRRMKGGRSGGRGYGRGRASGRGSSSNSNGNRRGGRFRSSSRGRGGKRSNSNSRASSSNAKTNNSQ